MQSDARVFIHDVASSVQAIQSFCLGHNWEHYRDDLLLRSACERHLEIIGEAMTRLRDRHPDEFDRFQNAHAIIGLRNRLIHGYDAVDSAIVWDIIVSKLPALAREARERLGTT